MVPHFAFNKIRSPSMPAGLLVPWPLLTCIRLHVFIPPKAHVLLSISQYAPFFSACVRTVALPVPLLKSLLDFFVPSTQNATPSAILSPCLFLS